MASPLEGFWDNSTIKSCCPMAFDGFLCLFSSRTLLNAPKTPQLSLECQEWTFAAMNNILNLWISFISSLQLHNSAISLLCRF